MFVRDVYHLHLEAALNWFQPNCKSSTCAEDTEKSPKDAFFHHHAKTSAQRGTWILLNTISAALEGAWGTVHAWLCLEISALFPSFWGCTCLLPLRTAPPPLSSFWEKVSLEHKLSLLHPLINEWSFCSAFLNLVSFNWYERHGAREGPSWGSTLSEKVSNKCSLRTLGWVKQGSASMWQFHCSSGDDLMASLWLSTNRCAAASVLSSIFTFVTSSGFYRLLILTLDFTAVTW